MVRRFNTFLAQAIIFSRRGIRGAFLQGRWLLTSSEFDPAELLKPVEVALEAVVASQRANFWDEKRKACLKLVNQQNSFIPASKNDLADACACRVVTPVLFASLSNDTHNTPRVTDDMVFVHTLP